MRGRPGRALHVANVLFSVNKLLFGEGLISTTGPQHTKQRKMLTPVFSRQVSILPIFLQLRSLDHLTL